jgi:hypothetical protein
MLTLSASDPSAYVHEEPGLCRDTPVGDATVLFLKSILCNRRFYACFPAISNLASLLRPAAP